MSYPVFYVPAGDVLPIFFESFDGGTGASITLTGLAVTDVEVYKDGSVTQRSSDAGYTLLDTDGIDFDGITGIHGFSIDTGDNTDAGFYTVGAWFTVVVSAVTIDAQTVSFVAAQFRLMAAESVAAKPKVDVDAWLGTAAATPTTAGVPEVDVTHWLGTAAAAVDTAGYPKVTIKDGTGAGEIALTSGKVDGVALVDTLTTYTGNTVQTGDAYARLGAPAGASVSADVAAVKTDTGNILTKLLKYVQLIVRKDAAIATDNATELNAINADGGSGAGAFANTTDSQEAIRDHVGDGTNLTEAGGTGDHLTAINLPNQTMDITGNITGNLSGSVGSVTGNVGGNVTGSIGSLAAQAKADVNAEADTALTDYDPPTRTEATSDTDSIKALLPAALTAGGNIKADVLAVSGDTTAADRLEALMDGILVCQVNDAGASTTAFVADGFTEATNDHFNGRLITFLTGALASQQTAITDYVGATQTFTVTTLTEAPANDDYFIIH